MRPEGVVDGLHGHLAAVQSLHEKDLAQGHGRVKRPAGRADGVAMAVRLPRLAPVY
jgi:hypothetical protein